MKVEVITSEDFDAKDLEDIRDVFQVYDDLIVDNRRMLRKSGAELPPEIWVFLTFTAWSLYTIFLAEGWNVFKERVRKLISKKKGGVDVNMRIHFKIDDKTIIAPIPKDSKIYDSSLDLLKEFLESRKNYSGWVMFDQSKWLDQDEIMGIKKE